MAALDPIQRVFDAMVECLDSRPEIGALTDRTFENVVPHARMAATRTEYDNKPVIGLLEIVSTLGNGEIGDWRRHQLQFDAEAAEPQVANELLYQVELLVTSANLAALTGTPLDAHIIKNATARIPVFEPDTPNASRRGLQLTIQVRH